MSSILRATSHFATANQFLINWGVRSISSYYKLFPRTFPQGPPPEGKFAVDLKALRQEYLALQQQSHPDVAGNNAFVDAAFLGSAYRTLRDPLLRSEHILHLQGIDSLTESKSFDNEELLMELMMLREQAAEAETPEELRALQTANNARIADAVSQLEAAFDTKNWEKARELTIELSYWTKLDEALQPKDEE